MTQKFELVRRARFRNDISEKQVLSWHVIEQWDAAEL